MNDGGSLAQKFPEAKRGNRMGGAQKRASKRVFSNESKNLRKRNKA
jgi:hypothetical protein